MIDSPVVTIVMANRDAAHYLPAAIESVLRQTLASWELILVDDGSRDDSLAVVERFAASDPRIKIVARSMGRGPAAARNRALDLAKGRWLAIFDSDDLMLPQRLERLVRRAEAEHAVIVADNLLLFSAGSPPRPFLPRKMTRCTRWIELDLFIHSNCLFSRRPNLGYLKPLIRADAVSACGLRYDETLRIGEDYNFLARLMAQGHSLLLEPTALYLYRKHQGSVSYRLRAADITALLGAEARLAEQLAGPRPTTLAALKRRQRTLRSLLAYDAMINAIKHGEMTAALSTALKRPHMWPLLTQPIAARLRRFRRSWRRRWNAASDLRYRTDTNASSLIATANSSAKKAERTGSTLAG